MRQQMSTVAATRSSRAATHHAIVLPMDMPMRQALLEMDDADPMALEALEGLYVQLERWENLKDVYMKMAELAPIPRPRARITTAANPGRLRICRRPIRRAWMKLSTHSLRSTRRRVFHAVAVNSARVSSGFPNASLALFHASSSAIPLAICRSTRPSMWNRSSSSTSSSTRRREWPSCRAPSSPCRR